MRRLVYLKFEFIASYHYCCGLEHKKCPGHTQLEQKNKPIIVRKGHVIQGREGGGNP